MKLLLASWLALSITVSAGMLAEQWNKPVPLPTQWRTDPPTRGACIVRYVSIPSLGQRVAILDEHWVESYVTSFDAWVPCPEWRP